MTDFARIRLPKIRGRRCLVTLAGSDHHYCNRAYSHTGRHAATKGAARVLVAVWE